MHHEKNVVKNFLSGLMEIPGELEQHQTKAHPCQSFQYAIISGNHWPGIMQLGM